MYRKDKRKFLMDINATLRTILFAPALEEIGKKRRRTYRFLQQSFRHLSFEPPIVQIRYFISEKDYEFYNEFIFELLLLLLFFWLKRIIMVIRYDAGEDYEFTSELLFTYFF